MKTPPPITLSLALVLSATACNLVDDEPSVGGSESGDPAGPSDNAVCMAAFDSIEELSCPAGFAPQILFDGGTSNVILVDDPTSVCS